MDPNTLLLLAVLACPIGMGVMMWMMGKNKGGQQGHSMSGDQLPANPEERLAALRKQRQMLEAEIAETTQLADLEAQREALLNERTPVSQNRAE